LKLIIIIGLVRKGSIKAKVSSKNLLDKSASSIFLYYNKRRIRFNRFRLDVSKYRFKKFHRTFKSTFIPYFKFRSSDMRLLDSPFFFVSRFRYFYKLFFNNHFKSARLTLRKPYNKLLYLFVFPFLPIYKRPSEIRMGKGKNSKFVGYAYPFRNFKILGYIRFLEERSPLSDFIFFKRSVTFVSKFPGVWSVTDLVF